MAKNENDIFDRKSSNSYTDHKVSRQSDIDSEIDKILAEARQSKNAEKDFFKEEKLSSNYSSDLPKYREEKNKEHQGTKDKRENSHSTREVSHREHSHKTERTRSHIEQHQASKDRKSLSHNRKKQPKKKSNGKVLIITVAIFAVVAGAIACVYTYLNGNTPFYGQSGNGNGENTTTTVPIHETLVVVTVSGTEISYDGEVLSSTEDLETRLNSEESLTLSLINNGADAETYNAVATVLNSFGGSYELMDEKNTNPSIDTGTSSTITSSPSAEDETEGSSPAQEVADNQQ